MSTSDTIQISTSPFNKNGNTDNREHANDEQKTNATPPAEQSIQSLDFKLSARVEAKLREVIPSEDPLDSAGFDVMEHVNSLFPSEESLGDVHDGPLAFRIQHIRRQVNSIDSELSKAVQQAAENRRKTQSAISETQTSIRELLKKVQSIKSKAEESEKMVTEICSDIRKLDNAKKNLSESITTLQKLHMLVSGVEQLQKDASTKSYDRAAHLVQALNDLFQHFEPHLSLTQLKSLKLDMEKCREELKKHIYHDFRVADPAATMDWEERVETLRNACEVINVLGDDERSDFISWVACTQLQAYGAIFAPGGEKSGIENLERRFEWLKNQLLKYNKHYVRIYPRYWNVAGNVCRQFCELTRKHMTEMLAQSQQLHKLDMNDLVKALEQCVSFEKELQRLYSRPSFSDDLEKIRVSIKNLLGEYDEDELYAEPMTADKIRIRYKLEPLKKKLAEVEAQIDQENAAKNIDTAQIQSIEFVNSLSCAFSKYMHYYVELEKKSIGDVLADIRSNEQWQCSVDSIPNEARYAGIDDLLGYIKSSIHRCAKIGGSGDIFYQIYFEYKAGLKEYVDLLQSQVNATNAEISSRSRNQRGIDEQLITLCLVVNTLDYLSDTLSALQGKLRQSMLESQHDSNNHVVDEERSKKAERLANKIDLSDIQEGKCDDLAANTVKCIAQVITERIGVQLDREIASCRKWNEEEQSSDRSSFVNTLKETLTNDIGVVHSLLVIAYHNLLNSQMSQRLIPKYTSCVFTRIRRISSQGALQLQLDTREFEKALLNLPMIAMTDHHRNDDGGDMKDSGAEQHIEVLTKMNIHPNQNKTIRVPNAYKASTSKQVNRIQTLLKTINTPYSPTRLDDIATFFKDVSDKRGSHLDLNKICEIKGLRKQEIQAVLATYNRMVPVNQQSKPLIVQSNHNKNNPEDIFNIPLGLLNRMTSGTNVFKKT